MIVKQRRWFALGIYSTKCEACKEDTKRPEFNDKDRRTYKYMYECNNLKCDVQRTVKKELGRYYQLQLSSKKKKVKQKNRR